MNKKIIIIFIFLILNSVYAEELNCQYKDVELYQDEIIKQYYTGTDIEYVNNPPLIFSEIKNSGGWALPCKIEFQITNTFSSDIILNLSWVFIYHGGYREPKEFGPITIPKNYYYPFRWEQSGCESLDIDPNTLNYKIIEPIKVETKRELTLLNRTVCKKCNNEICKDDGILCNNPSECGSGFCIRGICSNSKVCYNNDCKCRPDEIQCSDKLRCVKKGLIPLDLKPECNNPLECINGYINLETGLCAKSPAQIQQEELARKEKEKTAWIYAIIVIIFGMGFYWYLKNKHEKEKQKTIQKEIELEGKKIQRKEYELNELKEQIKEIERQKHKAKQEIRELEHLKSKRNNLISEIDKQYENITKPFPDSHASNRLVVINPHLGGYKCFFEKGLALEDYPVSSLVHRWVWKKYNNRYPKQGYHIHHIDEDKYNNDPRNLEEVEGVEHYEKHKMDV